MNVIKPHTSKGQLVPLIFSQAGLAANQSDVQLKALETPATSGALAVDGYTMPFAGEVVGVTADLSAAGSAGSLTAGASIGGTEDADTRLTVTTETSKTQKVARGKCGFAAGSIIGAEITTSSDWNGTSADLIVVVWVLLQMEGI